jgi:hypothetical protein
MIASNPSPEQTCRQHLKDYFKRYPNDRLEAAANRVVGGLLACRVSFVGKPGGWAGGIVYAVDSHGCGVPNVMNRELEEAFGTTMNTIYRRAAQFRRLLDF